MNSLYNDTIIAQCTPKGSGALALLRLSGENALIIADVIGKLQGNKKLSTVAPHTIHYGSVTDEKNMIIDRVLFFVMHAPHTFTGENVIEITCHNNPFIVANIINAVIAAGGRLAEQGEFSRRAVHNNKIDITQAEAINELIHANTQQALKQSLAQMDGSLSSYVLSIEKALIKAIALSEASFEFLDEENMEFGLEIKEIVESLITTIGQLKSTFNQQQQIRQGIRIAIIGSVNAGKSSLFNTLLHQNRAIVSNIAGTTRDSIEAGLYKNNNYWTLIDTAGLRTTDDVIEQQGILKSYEEAQKSDIILLVFDGSKALNIAEATIYNDLIDRYSKKIILVKNKSDLLSCDAFQELSNSLKNLNKDTEPLPFLHNCPNSSTLVEKAIQSKIDVLMSSTQLPFLLNQRHYNALTALEKTLLTIIPMLRAPISYELLSYHLQDAVAVLSQISGKTVSEASMDAVFREFCIGK
jgi:tRNA modification GTPase